MTESYVQGPLDGTGKKWRTRQRVIGANTVEEAYMAPGALPTYYYSTATTTGAALAQNKIFFDLFNASGSNLVIVVKKLFIQLHVAASVTGVSVMFDVDRTSAVGTGGTVITARPADTADPAMHANVTARHGATGGATKNYTLFNAPISTEETQAGAHFSWAFNLVPESPELREPHLRVGEGIRVIQITSSTTGTASVVAAITTEPA